MEKSGRALRPRVDYAEISDARFGSFIAAKHFPQNDLCLFQKHRVLQSVHDICSDIF